VAATFIIPVPPGFPLLVPGQYLDKPTVEFLKALSANEIIGLDADLGIRFFREEYLSRKTVQAKDKKPAQPVQPAKSEKAAATPALALSSTE